MISDHQVDHLAVDRFAESLRSRGKQPATVESYCRDAHRFLDYLGKFRVQPAQVEPETLLAFQEFLKSDCEERDNSVRRTVIGIRQFYRFLNETHAIKGTPFDMVPIPVRDDRLPKGVSPDDVESILRMALSGRPESKASRDAAMVSLLAHEGIKANELISLKWSDYLQENNQGSLRIIGPRARVVVLCKESNDLFQNYKRLFATIKHPAIVNSTANRVFIAYKGRDAASPLPAMTRHGLKFILYELGEKAGLRKLNTEQLRHFAVSYLISLGRSPEEIMLHLGLCRIGNIAKHIVKEKTQSRPRMIEGASRLP